jgi:hypothetical protein
MAIICTTVTAANYFSDMLTSISAATASFLADALMLAHFYAGFAGVARVVLQRAGHDPNA